MRSPWNEPPRWDEMLIAFALGLILGALLWLALGRPHV